MKLYDEQIEQLIYLAEDSIFEGDYENAKRMLMSAIYDEPGHHKLHYTLAWMYHYYQINEPLAERHYLATVHFDPSYFNAYRELTGLYFRKRKYPELQNLMEGAMSCEDIPREFVYETLGRVDERRGHFKGALANYKKALMYYMDNDDLSETRKTIKRVRWKRLRSRFK